MKIESVEKTAKVITALLKEKFPDVHFDVEAEYPNGTDRVVVRYTDGPAPPAAPLSFRPQRSGVEKSHCSMVQAALRWEISRLRATIEL